MARHTSISIPPRVREKLDELRRQLNASSWAEFFEKMIEIYEEWHRLTVEREVKQVLCNDISESRATLAAWGKLLASKLRDPVKIATALKYLKLDASGEYVVDKEQCVGSGV